MTTAQRRIEIYDLLKEQITVEVSELAKMFSVSTMTIRRDLAMFEKQGLVTTNYGGAYLNVGTTVEPSFSLKSGQSMQDKKAMGRAAAELVRDGESIILDCGTTTMQIMPYVLQKKITIITGSWGVVQYFQGNVKAELILAPGRYSQTSAGAMSETTADFFRTFHVDKAFLGVDGVDIQRGATVPDSMDAHVKRSILSSGKQCILMATGGKFGQSYLMEFSPLSGFSHIITDRDPGEEYQKQLRAKGISLLVSGEE